MALEDRRLLSTFTVDSTADTLTGGSPTTGTLRWAVEQANDATSASTIDFSLGSTAATITLSQGVLELSNTSFATTITGPGADLLSVSGNRSSRVFQVDPNVTATLSGLTITGGTTSGKGGGLYNEGIASVENCTISRNVALYGAGLDNANGGTVTLDDCTISNNSASYDAGFFNTGTATLDNCTISTNSAQETGGLFNLGTVTLDNSTISGNSSSSSGGGMVNDGTAKLTNCTISGNSAHLGGGLSNFNSATLSGCTISGNYAPNVGGLYDDFGTATLKDTIVAGNSGSAGTPSDVGGAGASAVTGSNNLIGAGGSGGIQGGVDGNVIGVGDPLLAPLGNYGGTTETMALLPGSPALGKGAAISGITTDQRGEPLDSPQPDIGAFQSQGFTLTAVAGSNPQSVAAGDNFANPLAVTVVAKDSLEPVAGGVITFTATPASNGASVNLSGTTATIGSNGVAQVTGMANSTTGSYSVAASSAGVATPFEFSLTNIVGLSFSGLTNHSISYGTASATFSGALAEGSDIPVGEDVSVTFNGVTRQAVIAANGAFSTTFTNTAGLGVAGSPYVVGYAYTSDGTFPSASSSSSLTVNKATPAVTVIDNGGTYNANPFPATATVTGAGGSPGSSLEGISLSLTYYLGSGTSGASLGSTPPISPGTYTVVANFPGSADYLAVQSAPVTFAISSPTATIALATSGGSAVYGQSVTFVATVSAASTTPTGTVTFFDGATSLGTVSLNAAGQASLTTTSLPVGTQSITATYNGNALLPAVQSGATSESVSQANTEIVLEPQPVLNKKKKVVSVGLKAEIEPVSPAGGVPTGVVTFEILKKVKKKVKATTLGTASVNGGQATLTLNVNKVLKKAITIVYSGDANFDSSTATPPALTQRSLKSLARPMIALVNRGHKRSDAATAVHRG
jgi:Bacterial Ig-like domain (group 3)